MDGFAAPRGPSVIQIIEGELDDKFSQLIAMQALYKTSFVADTKVAGEALGLATALAYLYNPYSPDVDAQRKAAHIRYAVAKNRKVR
jgi:hypothetical protein